MKKILIVALVVMMSASVSFAEKTKGGYVACVSEELYDEAVSAIVNKDERQFDYLMKNGCVVTKEGIPLSIIESGFGTMKVRAYVGDQSFVLFTPRENVVK